MCALAIAGAGAVRRTRERRANEKPSPERIARERRAEAEAAMRGTDGTAASAAIARAVEADVLARTGVNLRGTSGSNAVRELGDAGLPEPAARELLAVVAACEDARFSPSGVAIDDMRALWQRAEAAIAVEPER